MNMINMNDSIERYLSGAMNKDEEKWFLAEMQGNRELTSEVELRKKTNRILSDMSIIELRGKLEAIELNRRSANPAHRAVVRATRYAAAVAGVAVIASTIYFPSVNISPEKLYDRHFNTYQVISSSRSVSNINNDLFTKAMESIRVKDYHTAISYLEKVVSSDATNIESTFMLGVTNMEVKEFNKAEISFLQVLDQNDNLFIEDASWYLGLCYMITDEKEKALKQFEYIAASKSKYNKEARKLTHSLD